MSLIAAVITAAGASTRMGGKQKKEFLDLDGQPMLARAIAPLAEYCHPLVVTLPAGQIPSAGKLLKPYFNDLILIEGGSLRSESVYLALQRLESYSPDIVLIHDGARPCFDEAMVQRGLDAAAECGSAVAGVPVKDTIKIVSPNQMVNETPDRSLLWAAQTPQVFRYDLLLEAHRACTEDVTDDAAMLESLGNPVKMFLGSFQNIKVTTTDDLIIAEAFLKAAAA